MNSRLVTLDPRWHDDDPMCQGCRVRLASDVHHKTHKGMGGRKGAAKVAINQKQNLIRLCRVCHGASHNLRVIENGFSCALCPKVTTCFYGARLNHLDYDHLPLPWINTSLESPYAENPHPASDSTHQIR